ncbi:hypothetical protein LguiB_030233 [Lonicera macranthoides]
MIDRKVVGIGCVMKFIQLQTLLKFLRSMLQIESSKNIPTMEGQGYLSIMQ